MNRRILSGILALVMVFGLFGCTKTKNEPAETTEPAPQAADIYNEARAGLDSAEAVTLDVVLNTTTQVEDNNFTDESTQVVSYAGLNTDSPVIQFSEDVKWPSEEEEDEEETRPYTEIYAGGTLYVEVEDEVSFSGSLSQEACTQRYVPVVLLDAALYEEVTMETLEGQTTVTFNAPTAAESWAMPEEAQLQTASGTALIGEDGVLQKMTYTITYQYGSALVTKEVESTPRLEAEQVAAPEDTEDYLPLQSIEALALLLTAEEQTRQAQTLYYSTAYTTGCEAAGIVYKEDNTTYYYDVDDELLAKTTASVEYTSSTEGSQGSEQEAVYKDGKYVITTNGGLPTTQSGIKDKDIREAIQEDLSSEVAPPEYWTDVTTTDLGGIYLMEFSFNEDFGNNMQNMVSAFFFEDVSFLNSYATSYETTELNGYLSIDKYTGLITASGLAYTGVHVIDGDPYEVRWDSDKAIEAPAYGAYKEITGEDLPEEEPEQKAQPLFYHVTGADGQEMWLLGTIHVGDSRTAYLPQELYDAFAASDALALEFNAEAFEEQAENDAKLQQKLAAAYYYLDGSTVEDHLESEVYELALKYMKASGNNNMMTPYMKVALWANLVENFYLRLGHQLHSEQGVEERLTKLAKEQEKPIRDVESGLFQSQMIGNWSDELQALLMESSMETTLAEYNAEVSKLYEMWCAGDEQALLEAINEETDTSEMTEEELAEYNAALPLMEEYDKSMEFDRNEGMLKVAIEYLESDDVVFYAVGLAHLLNAENGLVEALRQAGYTVELVSYF